MAATIQQDQQTALEVNAEVRAFFARSHFPAETAATCIAFAQTRFHQPVHVAPVQGYCSFTLFVGAETVVQFRPQNYGLSIDRCSEVRAIFGQAAPRATYLGKIPARPPICARDELDGRNYLFAFALSRIEGLSLGQFRSLASGTLEGRVRLVRDMVHHFLMAWEHRKSPQDASLRKNLVGDSITARVKTMRRHLPSKHVPIVGQVLCWLPLIRNLPWVLTHGDVLPANIMVHPKTGSLSGLIDWTEAQWLPFGTGFYGAEEVLGEHIEGKGFYYYDDAAELRRIFWEILQKGVLNQRDDRVFWETVKMAHILGVLLWHGIAFDDGCLDRVVQPGTDDGELQKLNEQLGSVSSSYWPNGEVSPRLNMLSKSVNSKEPALPQVRLRLMALAICPASWRLMDIGAPYSDLFR